MMSVSEDSIDSSSSSSSSSLSNGPLYQLSDLMAQLPVKRGLSKYYNGKSQTFTSLATAKRLEDLSKKKKKKNKEDNKRSRTREMMSPKPTISKTKKPSSSSSSRLPTLFSSFAKTNESRRSGSLVVVNHCFRPLLPINAMY